MMSQYDGYQNFVAGSEHIQTLTVTVIPLDPLRNPYSLDV